MKSLKSNKREKRARKVTCITLIKKRRATERLWTWIIVWTLICSLTGFAPHCECYYFPLPLSNNSEHNERVWQKVKRLVINSFNWKKWGKRGPTPGAEGREGLEKGTRLKPELRTSLRPNAHHPCGKRDLVSDEVPAAKLWHQHLSLCAMPPAPSLNPLARVSARSYSGWSIRVARIREI